MILLVLYNLVLVPVLALNQADDDSLLDCSRSALGPSVYVGYGSFL